MFCACCSAGTGFVIGQVVNDGRPTPGVSALRRREGYAWRAALSASRSRFPPRSDVVFRNACLVTMDPFLGDLPRGDILVSDGLVLAVEPEIEETGGTEIEADGLTIVPGLIDIGRDCLEAALGDLFELVLDAGVRLSPETIYRLLRAEFLGCLQNGFTTVHHMAGRLCGRSHGDAAVLAQADCGLRGRFSFPASGPGWRNDLKTLRSDWFGNPQAHLLDLGILAKPRHVDGVPVVYPADVPVTAADERGNRSGDASLHDLTVAAATSLGLDDRVGSLTPGKRADLVILRSPKGIQSFPAGPHVLLSELRGRCADVIAVMVDGRLLKKDGNVAFVDDAVVASEIEDELVALRRLVSPAENGSSAGENTKPGYPMAAL